ncbi:MAG: DUF6588 family protein [Bacteroidota bacterium]
MKNPFFLLFCCLLLVSTSAFSNGSLDSTLQKMAGSAVQGYVGPIVSGFGADLNGGWFHKAPSAKMFGFDLELGVVAMGALFNTADKTIPAGANGQFSLDATQTAQIASTIPGYSSLPANYQSAIQNQISKTVFNVGISGPTIVGSKTDTVKVNFPAQAITVNTPGGTKTYDIPANVINTGVTGLLGNLSFIPLAAPQLSIGTIVGTQLTFRYLPNVKLNSDIGDLKFVGYGIQHNPGVWFPNPLPVDLCLSFFTQTLDAGTILTTKATEYGINASKTFGPGPVSITPYAGFMLESSKMTFDYTSTLQTPGGGTQQVHVNLPLTGENKSRLTLGLSLKLLATNINADYNFGTFKSVTAGLMFTL